MELGPRFSLRISHNDKEGEKHTVTSNSQSNATMNLGALGAVVLFSARHKKNGASCEALIFLLVGLPRTSPYRSSTRFPFLHDKNRSEIWENGLPTGRRASILGRKARRCFSQPDTRKMAPLAKRSFFYWSGCRESNSDLMLPKQVYYHYTTARRSALAQYSNFYGYRKISRYLSKPRRIDCCVAR